MDCVADNAMAKSIDVVAENHLAAFDGPSKLKQK